MTSSRRASRSGSSKGASPTALAAAVAALSFAGCSESVVSAAQPEHIQEVEPDDSSSLANWCGLLAPGSRRIVEGHVASRGPDLRDGFTFTAAEACTLRFRLVPSLPGADLDLLVCDPAADEFTGCFDEADPVEAGEIALAEPGEVVQLMICSAWASTGYSLEIEAVPPQKRIPEARRGESRRTLEEHSEFLRRNVPPTIAGRSPARPVLAFAPEASRQSARGIPMVIGSMSAR